MSVNGLNVDYGNHFEEDAMPVDGMYTNVSMTAQELDSIVNDSNQRLSGDMTLDDVDFILFALNDENVVDDLHDVDHGQNVILNIVNVDADQENNDQAMSHSHFWIVSWFNQCISRTVD